MILLRCISFLIGSLIVTGAPFLLLPDAPQRPSEPPAVMLACVLVALFASGFFAIALAGNHMKRSRRTRIGGGVLLAVPIVGSFGVFFLNEVPQGFWMIAPLFCYATFLFVTFVYPGKRGRSYRQLRPRDPAPSVNV